MAGRQNARVDGRLWVDIFKCKWDGERQRERWNGEYFEALFLLEAMKKRIRKSETKKARGCGRPSRAKGLSRMESEKSYPFSIYFPCNFSLSSFQIFSSSFFPSISTLSATTALKQAFRLFHSSYSCTIFNLLFNQPHSTTCSAQTPTKLARKETK